MAKEDQKVNKPCLTPLPCADPSSRAERLDEVGADEAAAGGKKNFHFRGL